MDPPHASLAHSVCVGMERTRRGNMPSSLFLPNMVVLWASLKSTLESLPLLRRNQINEGNSVLSIILIHSIYTTVSHRGIPRYWMR